jgi:hypothetical protein
MKFRAELKIFRSRNSSVSWVCTLLHLLLLLLPWRIRLSGLFPFTISSGTMNLTDGGTACRKTTSYAGQQKQRRKQTSTHAVGFDLHVWADEDISFLRLCGHCDGQSAILTMCILDGYYRMKRPWSRVKMSSSLRSILAEIFLSFPQSFQENAEKVPHIRSRLLSAI